MNVESCDVGTNQVSKEISEEFGIRNCYSDITLCIGFCDMELIQVK